MELDSPDSFTWTYSGILYHLRDGDTQEMMCKLYEDLTRVFVVRLLGIDCPETRGPSREAGLSAKDFARTLLTGPDGMPAPTVVRLTGRHDRYGRDIGSIEVNGRDLAETLLENGYARHVEYAAHMVALGAV